MDRIRGIGVVAGVIGVSTGIAFLQWQAGLIALSSFVLVGSIIGMCLSDERDSEVSRPE